MTLGNSSAVRDGAGIHAQPIGRELRAAHDPASHVLHEAPGADRSHAGDPASIDGFPVIAVTRPDPAAPSGRRIVGLVTPDNLTELVMLRAATRRL